MEGLYQLTQKYLFYSKLICGKIITVEYFEETKNQDGDISLRFPTVQVMNGNKREC